MKWLSLLQKHCLRFKKKSQNCTDQISRTILLGNCHSRKCPAQDEPTKLSNTTVGQFRTLKKSLNRSGYWSSQGQRAGGKTTSGPCSTAAPARNSGTAARRYTALRYRSERAAPASGRPSWLDGTPAPVSYGARDRHRCRNSHRASFRTAAMFDEHHAFIKLTPHTKITTRAQTQTVRKYVSRNTRIATFSYAKPQR